MPDITQRGADLSKIAAIHHPVRRQLLGLLGDGPATASQLAERSGQRVGNVSHHLRMLARAGLIEEAVELARDRRERWWRGLPMSLTWSVADGTAASGGGSVEQVREHQNLAHHVDVVHRWFESRGEYHPEWAQAAYATQSWLRLTAEELVELSEKISDLVSLFQHSVDMADGQHREPVFFFAHAVPAEP